MSIPSFSTAQQESQKKKMVEAKKKLSSHWWWLDSHNDNNTKRTPWLRSTLAELDEKTQAMLKIIEEDADSFAQRAEMYYKKRPELINMVEDFYRTHRSLAERYDQMKSESMSRLLTPWASPLSFAKYQPEKSITSSDKSYDSYSETYELEESDESEVDDPEDEVQVQKEMEKQEVPIAFANDDEMTKLRDEIERLKEENRIQKEQLLQKDEEKREVIRQLSVAVDLLREENDKLRKSAIKEPSKKQNTNEFNKLKVVFWRKLFNGSPISQSSIVALQK